MMFFSILNRRGCSGEDGIFQKGGFFFPHRQIFFLHTSLSDRQRLDSRLHYTDHPEFSTDSTREFRGNKSLHHWNVNRFAVSTQKKEKVSISDFLIFSCHEWLMFTPRGDADEFTGLSIKGYRFHSDHSFAQWSWSLFSDKHKVPNSFVPFSYHSHSSSIANSSFKELYYILYYF